VLCGTWTPAGIVNTWQLLVLMDVLDFLKLRLVVTLHVCPIEGKKEHTAVDD
jgi:hypothetical protein